MEISQIGSLAGAVSGQRTGDAVGLSVLKKALLTQGVGVLQLIDSVSQPQKPGGTTPTLGQHINTKA